MQSLRQNYGDNAVVEDWMQTLRPSYIDNVSLNPSGQAWRLLYYYDLCASYVCLGYRRIVEEYRVVWCVW
jgi:hypothetical protein